jgi:CRISPR-associated protein Csd2
VRYEGESFKKDEINKALKSEVIGLTDDDVVAVANALFESEDVDYKDKPPTMKDIVAALKSLADRLSKSVDGKKKLETKDKNNTRIKMIETYFDIRMFGAVLSTGLNAGQVRGPVQLTFAKSLDPIYRMDCGITRKAVTRETDRKTKENAMGRKPIVSYGLYRGFGFYSPYLAQKTPQTELTGDNIFVTKDDLKNLWEALWKGFDNDHSASRHIKPRGVYVFTHADARGNAPSHRIFDMLKIELKKALKDEGRSPSQFSDYVRTLPLADLVIGSTTVKIIPAEEITTNIEIPKNAVVLTKVYCED